MEILKTFYVNKNMCIREPDENDKSQENIKHFSKWVLDIGNGEVSGIRLSDESKSG